MKYFYSLILALLISSEVFAQSLDITPVIQDTPVWCWAATAEMVFTHYNLPNVNPAGNFQCGIVAVYFGPTSTCWSNCLTCTVAGGPMSNIKKLIDEYGPACKLYFGMKSPTLSSKLVFKALDFATVKDEIDNGRPIIAGITPHGFQIPGLAQHVVVISGYSEEDDVQKLIINDPFPYGDPRFNGVSNPYQTEGDTELQSGQYAVTYDFFKKNLGWGNTIYNIK